MGKKKRQIHCSACGSPADWYKKGRKHRVLVCEKCGIIANNPIPLLGLLGGAAARKALVTAGASAAGAYIGKKLVGEKTEQALDEAKTVFVDSLDKANPPKSAWFIREALKNGS